MIKKNMSYLKASICMIGLAGLLPVTSVFAQSVQFTNRGARSDGRPVLIVAAIGKDSRSKRIKVWNRSRYTLRIRVDTHSKLRFVRFRDRTGKEGTRLNLNLRPGVRGYISIHVDIKSGSARVYNDTVAFHVVGGKRMRTAKIPISVFAYTETTGWGPTTKPAPDHNKPSPRPSPRPAPKPDPDHNKPSPRLKPRPRPEHNRPDPKPAPGVNRNFRKPPGYEVWIHKRTGGPMRVRVRDLPLKVYSNHKNFRTGRNFDEVFDRSLQTWNVVGQSVGVSRSFFVRTNRKSQADIFVDWSANGLRKRALGVARLLIYRKYAKLNGIVMREPNARNRGKSTETLIQELGHMIGLGHSGGRAGRGDIMAPFSHSDFHRNLSEVQVSDRDRQALGWLYARRQFAPIVSPRVPGRGRRMASAGYYASDDDHGTKIDGSRGGTKSQIITRLSRGGSSTLGINPSGEAGGSFTFRIGRSSLKFKSTGNGWKVYRTYHGRHAGRAKLLRNVRLVLHKGKTNDLEFKHIGSTIRLYINDSRTVFKFPGVRRKNQDIKLIVSGLTVDAQ